MDLLNTFAFLPKGDGVQGHWYHDRDRGAGHRAHQRYDQIEFWYHRGEENWAQAKKMMIRVSA